MHDLGADVYFPWAYRYPEQSPLRDQIIAMQYADLFNLQESIFWMRTILRGRNNYHGIWENRPFGKVGRLTPIPGLESERILRPLHSIRLPEIFELGRQQQGLTSLLLDERHRDIYRDFYSQGRACER